MSQNPNGPDYNSYGPNPQGDNPNYPTYQSTAYGGSQPPSGPTPNYPPVGAGSNYPNPLYPPVNLGTPGSPYNPNTPPSAYGSPSNPGMPGPSYGPPSNPGMPGPSYGPPSNPGMPNPAYSSPSNPGMPNPAYSSPSNPGIPNSAYGSSGGFDPNTPNAGVPGMGAYNNPFTAPPPPTPSNPYDVPPTNPYDPYGTAPGGASANAGYPSFPPPGGQAPQAPKRRTAVIITVVVLVILILGGSIGGALINHNITIQHANATSTAVALTNANGTATAQVQQAATATAQAAATATAISSVYPFSNNLVLNDPLTDNSKGADWDNDGTFCKFAGSAYHVMDNQENTYQPCFGTSTNFSNFTFQAEMEFTQGDDNTLAGLIFRGNKASNKFYRLVFDDQGDCNIFVSVDTGGSNTRSLFQSCVADNFNTGLNVTNTIAIVANGDTLKIYVNQEEITSVQDSTFSQGQIGFEVEDQDSKTVEAIFNNAKVWKIS